MRKFLLSSLLSLSLIAPASAATWTLVVDTFQINSNTQWVPMGVQNYPGFTTAQACIDTRAAMMTTGTPQSGDNTLQTLRLGFCLLIA